MIFSGNVVAVDRVTQYLSMMEATLNATTLFYSRLSPEVAKKLNLFGKQSAIRKHYFSV
jgi:hypothetical protein